MSPPEGGVHQHKEALFMNSIHEIHRNAGT